MCSGARIRSGGGVAEARQERHGCCSGAERMGCCSGGLKSMGAVGRAVCAGGGGARAAAQVAPRPWLGREVWRRHGDGHRVRLAELPADPHRA